MTELKDKNVKKPKMTFKDAATKVLEAVKKAKQALTTSRKRKAPEAKKTPEETVKEVVEYLQEKVAAREVKTNTAMKAKKSNGRSV